MPVGARTSRTQVWLESLGEWTWPGQAAVAAEVLPPPWVPAFPPRRELVPAPTLPEPWLGTRPRRLLLGVLLSALAAVCVALALNGRLGLERVLGVQAPAPIALSRPAEAPSQPLPVLRPVSQDAAGSRIDATSFPSAALHDGGGSFLVYLPPGYASTTSHYPVLYLLHGNDQAATAFLQLGLQSTLDRLIASHAIQPMIAVMIQGGRGANNWRMAYESYVLEVQQLVDRMLPTVAARSARAIAGDSMGGYGSMSLALGNPYRFSVVESWLGFFNGLDGQLHADRPILSRLGLRAFVYGGQSDRIANPAEDEPWAAALRAAGAKATGIIYPGGHTMETLEAHLETMLVFAGRSLREAARPPGRPKAPPTHTGAHAPRALAASRS